MANKEHLKILKQGVKVWNNWRGDIPADLPDLRGADLCRADLQRAYLGAANLHAANLFNANLTDADLSGASLRGASLRGANLNGADLCGANLSGADLSHATLWGANLISANVEGTNLEGAAALFTIFADLDLSKAIGLDRVRHFAPSSIGIDTIYKSKGKIPEVFLRRCGVPDIFIKYIQSLVNTPLQFYSCFISHSSRDAEFCERLHNDLQAKGVRCWYAPEDLKPGDRFAEIIDRSIRVYDKLLIVLSQNSVNSEWVETEVKKGLERETAEKRQVLFPIRLDDAILEMNIGWPRELRKERHIGDFRNWKDHDSFTKHFSRLLRDLKAQAGAPGA